MDAEVASGRRPTKAPTLGLSYGSWVPPHKMAPDEHDMLGKEPQRAPRGPPRGTADPTCMCLELSLHVRVLAP